MGLWLWVDFLGLGCCGFYFGGCGLALRLEFLALISFFFFLNNFWVCVLVVLIQGTLRSQFIRFLVFNSVFNFFYLVKINKLIFLI